MFKAFEVALRESTRLAKQYNLEIDYMDSTVDDYIDPNDAIEPDEHTIVIKTGINIDTASSKQLAEINLPQNCICKEQIQRMYYV